MRILLSGEGLPAGDAGWRLLRRGKLGPLLYAARVRLQDRPLPESWRRRFRSDYLASVVSHHVYREATETLLAAVESAGLPAMVLRGGAVAQRLYGDPGLRPYTDIDLLVPRGRLDQARSIARDLGYLPEAGSLPDRFYERHHLHLRYVGRATRIPLEIHWALDHPFSLQRIDHEALLRAGIAGRLGGAIATLPSDVDLALILALHLAKHGTCLLAGDPETLRRRALWRGLLLWMVDLHRHLEIRSDVMDWDTLVRRAAGWEVARPVAVALGCVRAVLDAAVPAAALVALERHGGRASWVERGMAGLAGGRSPTSRLFRRVSGRFSRSPAFFGLERAAGLWDYLVPPGDWIARHGPCPGSPATVRRMAHLGRAGGRLVQLAGDLTLEMARRGRSGDALVAPLPAPQADGTVAPG